MGKVSVLVDAEGRLVLPEDVRLSLGLRDGETLMITIDEEGARTARVASAIRAAQARIPPWQPGQPLLSEEFIAERRAEAKREAERWG